MSLIESWRNSADAALAQGRRYEAQRDKPGAIAAAKECYAQAATYRRCADELDSAANGDGNHLNTCRCALADIAFSDDMTLDIARRKAERVYGETGPHDGPCPTFSASADDPDRCKHCGWSEEAHAMRQTLAAK